MAEKKPNPPRNDFNDLCYYIGLALVTWQRVEEVHFKIFCAFLGVPQSQIASAAYYSTESFAARNTMLNNMAQYFFRPLPELLPGNTLKKFKDLYSQWLKLHKLLKDTNDNRNKLAHYTADFDLLNMRMEGENVVFDVTPTTLRRSSLSTAGYFAGCSL